MRVDEFAIGFPPKLFSIKKGETEYSFNALPIGGFVRIFGENPDAILEEEGDKSRAFGSRPLWAQALVLVAGVTMNIVLAWVLFVVTFMMGVPTSVDENSATDEAVLYVNNVLENSPLFGQIDPGAEILGLAAGDHELPSPTPTQFSEFIQNHGDEDVEISFRNKEVESAISIKPAAGLIAEDPEKIAVGVALSLVETREYSFIGAVVEATSATFNGFISIVVGLFTLLANSITGTADFSQIAGPVGIVGMVGDAAAFGLTALLTFTAMISLNLAVINLLPIPALDGGRLVFVIYEAITAKKLNPIWVGRMNLIGFALLMILMVVVTYGDILRIINS
jgi:regulator of sigma E protease